MRRDAAKRGGFTLVELLVAAIVGALVATATVASVSRLLQVRRISGDRQAAFARADAAASQIAIDVQSAARDATLQYTKVRITPGGSGENHADELLLLTTSLRPARGIEREPEGQEFEVQFRLVPGQAGAPGRILRRVDPGLDEYLDAGGVVGVVAQGAASLAFEAYDGSEWQTQWDSDSDGMPHALRVVVVGASDDGRTTATVRRVIAMDRVPLPPASETSDAGTEGTSGGSGVSGSSDSSGSSAGGGR